jgi:hypothetical protein
VDQPTSIFDELSSRSDGEHALATVLAAYHQSFRIVFIIGAALAALAFCTACALMPQISLDRPDDKALKEDAARNMTTTVIKS